MENRKRRALAVQDYCRRRRALRHGRLWETWTADKNGPGYAAGDELEAFTIVTTTANDTVGELHNRMPVILSPDIWDSWLDGSAGEDVLRPYSGPMRV